MSKKSFKRLKNWLYREIKHKMELERMIIPIQAELKNFAYEDVKAAYKVMTGPIDSAVENMAISKFTAKKLNQVLADGLSKKGFIEYYAEESKSEQAITFYAKLRVVYPDSPKYCWG